MTSAKQVSSTQLIWTCVALMLLLLLTVGLFQLPLGSAHLIAGLSIAFLKTLLILAIFMNLKGGSGVLRMTAAVGILWLCFAILGIISDYTTRGWQETLDPGLEQGTHYSSSDRVEASTAD